MPGPKKIESFGVNSYFDAGHKFESAARNSKNRLVGVGMREITQNRDFFILEIAGGKE